MLTDRAPIQKEGHLLTIGTYTMKIQRIAAFSRDGAGGNPAGVVICPALPDAAMMQAIAKDVGYSETAFAAPATDGPAMDGPGATGWRVRYFAPEVEVPFCGHATIALGAALAWEHGDGLHILHLNDGMISVESHRCGHTAIAALQSPPTHSHPADPALVADALALFGYTAADLDLRIPPAIVQSGGRFLVLALNSRERLAAMQYDMTAGQSLMVEAGILTIMLVYARTPQVFDSRNPFASGGIYEDPATGAATAAFAGYLRDINWPHQGMIDLIQGEDMGMPSHLRAEISPDRGSSIRVSGHAHRLL